MTSSICKLFAYYAKPYRFGKQPGKAGILQQDFNRLVTWSKRWQLPFNTINCVSLHLGDRNPRNVYKMEGIELKQVTGEKHLGVIMDQELKLHHQTAAAVKKANRMLAIIKNSFAVLDIFYFATVI